MKVYKKPSFWILISDVFYFKFSQSNKIIKDIQWKNLSNYSYKHPGIYEDAKKVLVAIGLFFQARNDYLDCFGEITETGKEGTDIQENKVSWMAITALNKANEGQKEIMQSFYGQKGKP